VAVQRPSAGLANKITSVSRHPGSTACEGHRSFASISEVDGLSKQSGACDSFIEDQSAASSEDGSEVSYRWDLSAVDLPVRSVWAGNASCAFDSTGHYHAADDFGRGARQDRRSSTAGD
jgi:hypothetical protein